MIQLALDLELPCEPPPTLAEDGWLPSKDCRTYTHESGASVEFEGTAYLGDRRARINGGPWEPIAERFHVTLGRALEARP